MALDHLLVVGEGRALEALELVVHYLQGMKAGFLIIACVEIGWIF